MFLQIDENHAIKADRHCWQVCEARMKNGQRIWEPFLFYGSLESAIKGLNDLRLRTCDAQTLNEALKELERLSEDLCRALPAAA